MRVKIVRSITHRGYESLRKPAPRTVCDNIMYLQKDKTEDMDSRTCAFEWLQLQNNRWRA